MIRLKLSPTPSASKKKSSVHLQIFLFDSLVFPLVVEEVLVATDIFQGQVAEFHKLFVGQEWHETATAATAVQELVVNVAGQLGVHAGQTEQGGDFEVEAVTAAAGAAVSAA